MQYQSQTEVSVIGSRRRQRLFPAVRDLTSHLKEEKVSLGLVLVFLTAHIPLAILMSRNSNLATFHAVATIAWALWLAVTSQKIETVAYAGAYITGAEVLWRMSDAQSYWEIGKYGVAAVFIVAMIRHRRARSAFLPVLYFVLLLPSALLTLRLPFNESKDFLSANLSGPLALMVAAVFFSQLSLSRENLLRVFLALLGPVVGVAAIAFFGVATAKELTFTLGSNFDTSGGFGPNQVSAILGLGALTCFLILLDNGVELKLKVLCGGVMMGLAAQSALTFSRGGLYNVVGAITLASLFLLRDRRTRLQFLLAIFLISAVSYFVIFPRLERFTDGALLARFEQAGTAGRDVIARYDIEIWLDNFILGVGPGIAREHRRELGHAAFAHTEFTRLLAEHGLFGLVALFVIAGAAVRNLIKARTAREKALVVALTAWSFLFMLNAGMRIVAPSIMFGLAFAFSPSPNQKGAAILKRRGLKKPSPRNQRWKSLKTRSSQ